MTISDSTISGNRAGFSGGGIANEGYNEAVMSVINCVITGNHATAGGGGINNGSKGRMTITDCEITGNTTDSYGGGIQSVYAIETVVRNSTISDNSGFGAGGIDNAGGSPTVLVDSVIANNTSTGTPSSLFPGAGGINNSGGSSLEILRCSIQGNRANHHGGGLRNEGSLTIIDSTLAGNSAAREGGAILNWRQGQVLVTNSTLSGNEARDGGGLFNQDAGGRIEFSHCTITGNAADPSNVGSGLGGGIRLNNGTAVLHNTLVAGTLRGGSAPDDISNNNISLEAASSYNLIGDPNSAGGLSHGLNGNIVGNGNGSVVDITKVLETALSNHGGPTLTHVLVAGSPALNAGNPGFSNPDLPYDQRGEGFPRVLEGRLDIGAVEVEATEPPDCLAESASRSMGIPLPLGVLRGFRDEVLSSTKDGRRLRQLYYSHSPELIEVFASHPELAARSLQALLQSLPAIQTSRTNGLVSLDRRLHTEIGALLRECKTHAGPELSAAIDEVAGLLHSRTRHRGPRAVIDLGEPVQTASAAPKRTDFRGLWCLGSNVVALSIFRRRRMRDSVML